MPLDNFPTPENCEECQGKRRGWCEACGRDCSDDGDQKFDARRDDALTDPA